MPVPKVPPVKRLRSGLTLWLAGMVGTAAALPYLHATTRSATLVLAVSAVLLAIAVILGRRAGDALGLGAPFIDGWLNDRATPDYLPRAAALSLGIGLVTGLGTGLAAQALQSGLHGPAPASGVAGNHSATIWAELLSSLFGGVTEEIYLVWCFLSVSALLLKRFLGVPATKQPSVPTAAFWSANVLTAIVLGLLHLPGAAGGHTLSAILVGQTLLLSGTPGLLYGWLFRRYGIELAMLAHLTSDLCLHGLAVFA